MHKSLIVLLAFFALRSNFSSAQESGQRATPLDTWFEISEGENWNTNLQITVSKNRIWLKSSTKVISQSISATDYRLITDAAVKMVTNGVKSTLQAPKDRKCYLRVWDNKGQITTKWTGEITDPEMIMTMINSLMGEKTIEEFVARRTSSEPRIQLPERIKALRCTEKGSLNRYPVKTYNELSDEGMITLFIGGNVHRPGKYTLPGGTNVVDAVEAAGGLEYTLPYYVSIERSVGNQQHSIYPFRSPETEDWYFRLEAGDIIRAEPME